MKSPHKLNQLTSDGTVSAPDKCPECAAMHLLTIAGALIAAEIDRIKEGTNE
jgi:hypothetical protein